MFRKVLLNFAIWKWKLRSKFRKDVFELEWWYDEGRPFISLKEDERSKDKI
jgi:hypothetical protein